MSWTPASRTPLLASAQSPGMSQRTSDGSLASVLDSYRDRRGYGSSSSSVYGSAQRYGPSANLASTPPTPTPRKTVIPARPEVPGMLDEDDLDDQLHTLTPYEKGAQPLHSIQYHLRQRMGQCPGALVPCPSSSGNLRSVSHPLLLPQQWE